MSDVNGVKLSEQDLAAMTEEQILSVPFNAIEQYQPFSLFPAGAFIFNIARSQVGTITKGKDTFRGIDMLLKVKSVMDLMAVPSNEGLHVDVGSEFEVNPPLSSVKGWATGWNEVVDKLGVSSQPLPAILAALNGKDIQAVVVHVPNKDGKLDTKTQKVIHYAQIRDIKLA